jgi:hypothetical protein
LCDELAAVLETTREDIAHRIEAALSPPPKKQTKTRRNPRHNPAAFFALFSLFTPSYFNRRQAAFKAPPAVVYFNKTIVGAKICKLPK